MTDAELKKLYKQIENDLDNLKAGTTKQYETPYFTDSELMAIPNIVEYLQKNKFDGTINFKSSSLRTVVTKVEKNESEEKSVFSNLVFEKSEQQLQAEEAYNKCIAGKHTLTMTNKTTFKSPLLVCQQCKLGYTFKLNSGTQEIAKVIQL